MATGTTWSSVVNEMRLRLDTGPARQRADPVFAQGLIETFKQTFCYSDANAGSAPALLWLKRNGIRGRNSFFFVLAVARSIGEDWRGDTCNFFEVTVAFSTLQRVLNILRGDISKTDAGRFRGQVLICTPNGEQHTFGQSLLQAIFELEDWRAVVAANDGQSAFLQTVELLKPDVVCIGWHSERLQPQMENLLKKIKSIPAETRPAVICGGNATLRNADWISSDGVNQIARNMSNAVDTARVLLNRSRHNKLIRKIE